MMAKVIKLLHLFGLDTLFLGFIEKLLLELNKKLAAYKAALDASSLT